MPKKTRFLATFQKNGGLALKPRSNKKQLFWGLYCKKVAFHMWARNFFCCALMGKRFQGVKDYPWGARKMHNEVRPSANTWRISSRLLTHCMLTFAFEPKRVSFVCVTKKHTFPRASSRWRNSQPPNSSPKFRLKCILKAKTLWSFLYQMARKSF